jgi:glycine cleavage system H protein
MNFPQDLKYAKSHEWLRIEGNVATVGITDYAQSELGDVVFVDITAAIGDDVSGGSPFGTIEAVKTVADVYLPVSGKLLEVNPQINDDPELINKDPYGAGWMVKIEVDNPDTSGLMNAEEYSATVGH